MGKASGSRLDQIYPGWNTFSYLAAALGGAAALFFYGASAVKANLGALAILNCSAWGDHPQQGSACESAGRFAPFAGARLRGTAAYHAGRFREAVALFEQALSSRPGDPVALYWFAHAAYHSGDRSTALQLWRGQGERTMAAFFRRSSETALENGEIPAAREYANLSIEIDPAFGEGFFQLGTVQALSGQPVEAALALHEALNLDLEPAQAGLAYHSLGDIEKSLGRDQEALQNYRLAAQYFPANDLFQRDLADQYVLLRRYSEARAVLDRLRSKNPADAGVLVRMGNIFLDQGDYAAAATWYQAAVSADPKSGNGEAALGRLYRAKGQLDQAVAHFRRAIELDPKKQWVGVALGAVYWQLGQVDQAIETYLWVTAHPGENGLREEAWVSLAKLYTLKGDRQAARSAWSAALQINPANEEARQADRELK